MAFDVERFRTLHTERGLALGDPFEFFTVTGSTNDEALERARSGAPHGATFVADAQTSGRGRRNSAWFSASGMDLLFSVLLRPKLAADALSGVSLSIGLAVRDVLAPRLTVEPLVKWPNDVLVGDKKLSGVLIESQISGEAPSAVVVGVGINVETRDFPDDLAAKASSLALLGARSLSREELLCDVLAAIDARVRAYEVDGVAGIAAELRAADALLGRRVRAGGVTGVARGIDQQGRLIVEDASGTRHALISGSAELI